MSYGAVKRRNLRIRILIDASQCAKYKHKRPYMSVIVDAHQHFWCYQTFSE